MLFSLEAKLIAGLCLALSIAGFYEWQIHAATQAGKDECRQAYQAALVTEQQRRTTALAEVSNEAQRMANRARADAVTAGAAGVRLRDRARAAVASAPAAGSSAPALGAGLVLADVLGRVDDAAGQLAAALDDSRGAGLACEAAYDSLTKKP